MVPERFESSILEYREICLDDSECIVQWRSTPSVYKYFQRSEPLSLEDHLSWYNQHYLNDSTRIDYMILHKVDRIPIGIVTVSDLQKLSMQVGYLVGAVNYQRQGYATEAINALIREYQHKGVSSFYAEIHRDNEASIKTIEKCGFVYEKHIDALFLHYNKITTV